MPQGSATTEIHADQTVTVIIGFWNEEGPIRGESERDRMTAWMYKLRVLWPKA